MTAFESLDFIVKLTDLVSGPANKIISSTDRMKSGFEDIAYGAAGIFSVGFAIDRLTDKAVRFESVMADVRKTVNFGSDFEFQQFGKDILQMTKELPLTAEGLGEIAAAGGRLGLNALQLPDFVNVTAKMSTAFDLQTELAGEYAANLSNIYKIPVTELSQLGDVVNHLSDNTAAKAGDIINVLQRTGGIAQNFGLATNEVAALSAQMLALGIPAEQVGTSVNAMLSRLLNLEAAGPKVQNVLNGMGLTAKGFADDMIANPQAAINSFLTTISGLDAQKQSIALSTIFGLEHAPKVSLLANSMDQYGNTLALVSNELSYLNSMQTEFDIRAQTSENKAILFGNAVDRFMISAGNIALPVMTKGMEMLSGVIDPISDKLTRWTNLFPTLTSWLGNGLAAVLLLVAGMGALSIVMGLSKVVMAGWAVTSAAVTLAIKGLSLAMYSLPIFALIGAVALFSYGLYKLWDDWDLIVDGVGAKLTSLIDGFKNGFQIFKNWLSGLNIFEIVGTGVDWLISKINLIPGIDISTSNPIPPPRSIQTGGDVAQQGGFAQALSQSVNSNSRSIGEVTIHNYGEAMSASSLDDELEFAAGY